MTHVLLVRHAEPSDAALRRLGGNPQLSEHGARQAARLAQEPSFEKATALFSSPARRALETATPIGAVLGVEPQILSNLREIDFGRADGLTYEEVETEFPDFYDRLMNDTDAARFPDGESRGDLQVRVRTTLDLMASAQPGELENLRDVIVVTHAGVIRAASSLIGLENANPDYASITEIWWPTAGSSPP